ncbi:hypothetical protein ACFL1G_06405 [Planctomycetota bacterium]
MVDSRIQKLENDIRDRISRIVADNSSWCLPRYNALQKIRELDRYAFLCGGAVRDILLANRQNSIVPRDLDIVLGYIEVEKVADSFSDSNKKWNCYGGVSVQLKDWSIDVWSLNKTWAFVEKHVEGKGFSDFPKTTFLDIEAVAVQLFCRKLQKRKIYSKGFFEAILKKTIEINLEENPNPNTCIIRSLNVAKRFKFAIGPKLAKFIAHHARQTDLEELWKLYQIRYKLDLLTFENFYLCIKAIEEQLRISNRQPVKLPTQEIQKYFQPVLWSNLVQKNTEGMLLQRI